MALLFFTIAPYDNRTRIMMDQYFEDEAPASESTAATEETGDDQTFVLPKSIAEGKSVGDTLTVKIVADHEDSYEVQLAGDTEPEAEPSMPMKDEMASYMD